MNCWMFSPDVSGMFSIESFFFDFIGPPLLCPTLCTGALLPPCTVMSPGRLTLPQHWCLQCLCWHLKPCRNRGPNCLIESFRPRQGSSIFGPSQCGAGLSPMCILCFPLRLSGVWLLASIYFYFLSFHCEITDFFQMFSFMRVLFLNPVPPSCILNCTLFFTLLWCICS